MVRARRRFGQHFLEPAWVAKLVDTLDARPEEAFVEVGPGRGAITVPLASQSARVLGIEVDRDLAAELTAAAIPGLTVLRDDVLHADLASVIGEWLGAPLGPQHQVRVVGNLPYNISSPILFRLLDLSASTQGIRDATLMLQREVADRIIARPGTREYGVLSILTALRADAARVLALPPGAFRPAPRVSSAVVRLSFRPPPVSVLDEPLLTRLVRSIFTQRRKTLANALKPLAARLGLSPGEALAQAEVDGRRRPETLQLVELARLADVFASAPIRAVL